MEEHNKIENLIWSQIVYPDKFINKLIEFRKKYDKNKNKNSVFSFLTQNMAFVFVTVSKNKSFYDESVIKTVQEEFGNHGTLLLELDEEEMIKEIDKALEFHKNGLSIREFQWHFFKMSIHLTLGLEGTKQVLPALTREQDFESGFVRNTLVIGNKEWLIKEPYVDKILKLVDIQIKRWADKKGNNKRNKRDPIDSRLRHEVFKRDNYTCKECGKHKSETVLHVDHIISIDQGGSDELDNLQTLCENCNLAKSNKCWKSK